MADLPQIPQRNLTVYLLKDEFKEAEDAISAPARLKKFPIRTANGNATLGALFIKAPRGRAPKWAAFFEDHVDLTEFGRVASSAGVLLVKTRGRLFALVFGAGRFLLEPDCWEERFGLRVALNSIDPDKIRSLDKRTFDALSTHTRIQGSRDGSAQEFGLDVEQDLVRAVTGKPTDEVLFGNRLSGMDSVHCALRIDVTELKPVLRTFLEKNDDVTYKQHFPWIDQIAEVSSRTLIAELDASVVANINGERERCWLCVPEVIDWNHTDGFRYGFGPRDPEYQDLSFGGLIESLDGRAVDLEVLRRRRAYQVDGEDGRLNDWPVYRCIYAECVWDGRTFVLSSGRWYEVDRAFVGAVDRFYDDLPRYERQLPEYNDSRESTYCSRVAAADPETYALMDQKMIQIGGAHGSIEFCDLFVADKTLIHVKRYGASSVLSHLFAQGVVAGEAFRSDESFRGAALEFLPERHRLFARERAPERSEYQVVFAIVSGKDGPLTLPFFSRVSLRQACRRLDAFGFRTALVKIQTADECVKLKKFKGR